MKKALLLLVLCALIMPAAFAQNFSVDAGVGLYYDAVPMESEDATLNILEAFFNLRGGVYANARMLLSDSLSIGVEAGLQYMQLSIDDNADTVEDESFSYGVFDLPLYAIAKMDMGGMSLMPFGGLLVRFAAASDADTSVTADMGTGLTAGARLCLGSLYVEGAYVIGLSEDAESFPRVGVGINVADAAFF